MENLQLYYLPTCPYCLKVMRFMEKNGIELDMKSTTDPQNAATLLQVGGKNQVPCLFIDGAPMYESDDIIAWLGAHCVK